MAINDVTSNGDTMNIVEEKKEKWKGYLGTRELREFKLKRKMIKDTVNRLNEVEWIGFENYRKEVFIDHHTLFYVVMK